MSPQPGNDQAPLKVHFWLPAGLSRRAAREGRFDPKRTSPIRLRNVSYEQLRAASENLRLTPGLAVLSTKLGLSLALNMAKEPMHTGVSGELGSRFANDL